MEPGQMTTIDELREAIVEGQTKTALAQVNQGLAEGTEAGVLLREGLIAAMAQVGRLYEEGEVFVPEMLVAARAMTAALGVLSLTWWTRGWRRPGRWPSGPSRATFTTSAKTWWR